MSIADGQLVLQATTADFSGQQQQQSHSMVAEQHPSSSEEAGRPFWQSMTGSNVDVSGSVSRIGCRAYPPAMATLAPSIRFDLAQAVDAQRFGTDRAESGLHQQHLQRAALLQAALAQPARQPVPLEEQVTSFSFFRCALSVCMLTLHASVVRCWALHAPTCCATRARSMMFAGSTAVRPAKRLL